MRGTVTGLCAVLLACGPTQPTLHDEAEGAEGDGTAAAEGADAGESSAGDDSAATTGGDGSDLEDDERRPRLAVGNYHSCVLREDGAVRCWGDKSYGALGLGADFDGPYLGDREPPTAQPPIDLAGTAVSIGSGRWHVCAHMQSKALRCWGSNVRGQLGVPRIEQIGLDDVPSDHAPVDVGFDVSGLWVSGSGTCARGAAGTRCWQPPGGQALPAAPSPAGDLPLSGLRAASESCVVTSEGELRCWGANEFGQVGVGHTEEVPYDPQHMGEVVALPEPVVDVQQGALYRTCVVLASGAVRCWGVAENGVLGYGELEDIGDDETPAQAGDVPLD